MTAGSLARDLVDLFLPRACLGCGERIPPEESEGLVCVRCRGGLRPPSPPLCERCSFPLGTGRPPGEPCPECARWDSALVFARSSVILDPAATALVHALKYNGWREIAEFMSGRMERDFPRGFLDPVLVPVPTTARRRWTRGYNQAALLAEGLSGRCSIPYVDGLLRPDGRTQVRLGPRERQSNVQGAFVCRDDSRSLIRGREVILIDDVLTTGATALAATSALVAGGAVSVGLLTFARSLPYEKA